MPKYVIGGKGCGKTHILRYFSYPLQKIRYNDDITNLLAKDRYIGLYSLFGGLNSSRFDGKGVPAEQWESIFEYYFELYIVDNLLNTTLEILNLLQIDPAIEQKLTHSIISIFTNFQKISGINTIQDSINFLFELRRKVDSQVLNAAFTRKLDFEEVKILFAPGDLIFGIPLALAACLSHFKNVKFIYIFDEYEKMFDWQKKFVNTLVWDKKVPVTFWIGARRYGYTTRQTKSGEAMKPGSEFQEVNLDVIIRSNEDIYVKFAEKLYTNRLLKYYQQKGLKINGEEMNKKFCDKFEQYSEDLFLKEIIEKNKKKYKEFKHLRELRKKLSDAIKINRALEITDENEIDSIIKEIIHDTDDCPLEQKYKVFYLYQLWFQSNKKTTFKEILREISSEYSKYKSTKLGAFKDIKDKRKKDFLAQLSKENNIKNKEYSGIDKFIELSQGNPRTLILILKKTIEFSTIRGERPLEDGGAISLDSQYLAVYDTARWFYEDAEVIGESGKLMYSSLKNLADYFIIHRFCDKPTETTVSSFYIKSEEVTENALSTIEVMKIHSIVIEDESGRLEKNSGRKQRLFQLNKILAPLWNLPIVVRGQIYLNKESAEAIFDINYHKYFEKIFKERKGELNAPDFLKISFKDNSKNLFS